MKVSVLIVWFTCAGLGLSAQKITYENTPRVLSFTDTNYIYIGVPNQFGIDKGKLSVIRISSGNNGISSRLQNTYFEVFPKHEGFFTVTLETADKNYHLLFVARRLSDPEQ